MVAALTGAAAGGNYSPSNQNQRLMDRQIYKYNAESKKVKRPDENIWEPAPKNRKLVPKTIRITVFMPRIQLPQHVKTNLLDISSGIHMLQFNWFS